MPGVFFFCCFVLNYRLIIHLVFFTYKYIFYVDERADEELECTEDSFDSGDDVQNADISDHDSVSLTYCI